MTPHQRLVRRAERFLKRKGNPLYADSLPGFMADFGLLVLREARRKKRPTVEDLRKAV